jgi:arylsulfatase A-like enzyme
MKDSLQPRLSLILVTVDCLRGDHVGYSGYQGVTTPFLDSLAKEALVFQSAIVAGAPTYYSFPAILASRYPLDLGRDIVGLAPGERTLATTLQNAGYATAAFCAGNPYLTRRFGYHQGFETFRDFQAEEPVTPAKCSHTDKIGLRTRLNQKLEAWSHSAGVLDRLYDEIYFEYCQRLAIPKPHSMDELRRFPSADVLVDEATAWLNSLDERPFFLWLHFMDPHAPYYPMPEAMEWTGTKTTPFRARYQNAFWNRGSVEQRHLARHRAGIIALYDAGVRWVDAQVARLCASLRQLGRWRRCVFALTADHGEEFLEHGGRFHSPDKLTEELTRVPLLLRVPGQRGLEVTNPFGLVDLAPTLIDVLCLNSPPAFCGRSRWRELRDGSDWDEPVITECVTGSANPFYRKDRLGPRILAVRDKRYKLVWEFSSGQELLFDLETDPTEIQPLARDRERKIRSKLLLHAHRHLNRSVEQRDHEHRFRALLEELEREWQATHPRSLGASATAAQD